LQSKKYFDFTIDMYLEICLELLCSRVYGSNSFHASGCVGNKKTQWKRVAETGGRVRRSH